MTQDLQNAYLRAKVYSASPEELRLMLLDGALRFTRQAREGLIAKNAEASFSGFSNARAIVLELAQSLTEDNDPDLRAKVTSVFMFIYRRLVDANLEKSVAIVDEAIGLLEYERETWALYLERFGLGSGAAASHAHAATAHAGAAEGASGGASGGEPRPGLCVQG